VKSVRFSPLAESDLVEIMTYIARDNPARALSFVGELEAQCEALGEFPGMGVSRSELAVGLRMMPHANYLIFYRELEDHIRIERVLHGARDLGDLMR
jgi:toxin ParE1/3/4